jgi:hypothetical protein
MTFRPSLHLPPCSSTTTETVCEVHDGWFSSRTHCRDCAGSMLLDDRYVTLMGPDPTGDRPGARRRRFTVCTIPPA